MSHRSHQSRLCPSRSVERVRAALRREQPDRVPVMEFIIDEKVARALVPDMLDIPDAMDRLGLDAVGCGAHWRKLREHLDGTYEDEWGVTYLSGGSEAVAHPIRGPIRTMEDARAYQPPDPDADHLLANLREIVSRYKGKRAICFHHRAAFMWSAYLMGIENLLASFLTDPELANLVMDKVLECNMRIVRNAIRSGAEIVVLGDDYADNRGPMMSPAVFEELILPRLSKMVSMIRAEGAFCIKHTDGNIYPLLEMIISSGCDGINPIEPAAGMDLREVKRLVGDRVCVTGNIDCGRLLSFGTAGEVEQAVLRAIQDAGAGGGYILMSSNSIHSSVKPENLAAMIEAAHRHGRYL